MMITMKKAIMVGSRNRNSVSFRLVLLVIDDPSILSAVRLKKGDGPRAVYPNAIPRKRSVNYLAMLAIASIIIASKPSTSIAPAANSS